LRLTWWPQSASEPATHRPSDDGLGDENGRFGRRLTFVFKRYFAEIIALFLPMFRPDRVTKQFSPGRNHFPLLAQISGNSRWLSLCQRNGGDAGTQTGDSQMRTISFILAFAFMLAGPSMAGSSENGMPGVGTFAYNGAPGVISAPQAMVVAAK
jgi:hypothetical protein